ncbi:MAG: DUF5615 family PIN-like protein [Chloroflexota bacterium]
MFRLYHDEDALQAALVAALRRAGFDCLTAGEARMRGQPDDHQLAFATGEGRVLYTRNTGDFRRLDAEWRLSGRHHAGIIVLTGQRTPIGAQLRAIHVLAEKFTAQDMADRLEFLLNYS